MSDDERDRHDESSQPSEGGDLTPHASHLTPLFAFELFVAVRYLRSRRKQVMLSIITAIAVGAVAVGVAALVLVMALMTGFREDMQSRILAGTAHMNLVRRDGLAMSDYRDLVTRLTKVEHI